MTEPTSRQREHLTVIRQKLDQHSEAEEGLLATITRARRDPEGLTWEQIGEVLGTTRQAAQQRYGAVTAGPTTDLLDAKPTGKIRNGTGLPRSAENWRLILAAARALTAVGQTPFTRIGVYKWIWERYPSREHGRPSLDPTFQGMIRNATGGPPSAAGTPLLRVRRGLYVLADSESADGPSKPRW
jgi:hypothetical protein